MERRHFLMGSAAALGAAASVFGSPSDTVRIGQIGVGTAQTPAGHGRGRDHIAGYGRLPNVEIVAVADIDQTHLDEGAVLIEKTKGKKPQCYTDLRKLLEDKSIEKRSQYMERVLDEVRSVPGVQAAGSTHFLPLTGFVSGSCFAPAPGPEIGR